jgi:hypothetical protein
MEGIMASSGVRPAFPPIFSVHGEIMHNPYYDNRLQAGNIVINDSGAESPLHYAGDITRTIPVGARFSARQREIYSIVLNAQAKAIAAAAPGVEWREVHRLAASPDGELKNSVWSERSAEAVAAGACCSSLPASATCRPRRATWSRWARPSATDTISGTPSSAGVRLAKPVGGLHHHSRAGIYFIRSSSIAAGRGSTTNSSISTKLGLPPFGGIRIGRHPITPEGCRVLGPHPQDHRRGQAWP